MTIELEIQRALDASRFAVLATQEDGQPHTSLMAFTPMEGIRQLVVATYRATLKYRSLRKDGRVAVLIDGRERQLAESNGQRDIVITAHGIARDVPGPDYQQMLQAHLDRHPQMQDFLTSPDCALLTVAVSAYEVVGGTDDVRWYSL